MKITFNAFFLKGKLEQNGIMCDNAKMELNDGMSLNKLIKTVNLEDKKVEAIFVNHKLAPKETIRR